MPSTTGHTDALSFEQTKELLGLGSSLTEIREYQHLGFNFDQIRELVETASNKAASDREATAKATAKAQKHENTEHPGKSVFSYPEGDKAKPRVLARRTFWCGGLLTPDTSTAAEIELLNKLEPGEYVCTKADGSKIKVQVKSVVNATTGAVDQLEVWFPHKGKQRDNLKTQVDMLREIVAQQSSMMHASVT